MRVYGSQGKSNPYIIRSHSEDRKGAAVQALLPLGETVTTIQNIPAEKTLLLFIPFFITLPHLWYTKYHINGILL